jgi:hypothetical protein
MLESPVLKDCLQLYNYILKIIRTIKEYLTARSEFEAKEKSAWTLPEWKLTLW